MCRRGSEHHGIVASITPNCPSRAGEGSLDISPARHLGTGLTPLHLNGVIGEGRCRGAGGVPGRRGLAVVGYGMLWHGVVRYAVIQYGFVFYGMVGASHISLWRGMVWWEGAPNVSCW